MKTELEHIPEHKRQELLCAAEIIQQVANPEMIILFGSYARGDWVEEKGPDGNFQYQSDFDLLVITETEYQSKKTEGNRGLWNQVRSSIRTPVSIIAEDIKFFNRRLGKGQYFYIDIKREGVLLYNSGKYELAEPRDLHPSERKRLAESDYEYSMKKAISLTKLYQFCLSENELNQAAFQLHQMTESLYTVILLVFTRYKPSTHDLSELSKRITSFEPRFLSIFPQGSTEEKRRFELLRKAYVDARYNKNYTITNEELEWLAERIHQLRDMTEALCTAKVESYAPEQAE